MQIGMIGLGRMGANMVRRLLQGGHECVAYDPKPEAVQAVAAYGARGVDSLAALVQALKAPRALWIMVPAGIVDAVIQQLRPLLARGRRADRWRQLQLPRRHPPLRGARACRDALSGRRHERRRARLRTGLLSDDRRRCRGGGAHRAGAGDARPGRSVARRRRRRPRRGGPGVSALRSRRRRALREDGAQRHRVRAHGRVRGRP